MFADFAIAVTALHALFILWVIGGAWLTVRRPWLAAAHIASLVWGVVVEVGPWPCPLTILEQRLETAAGAASYHGAFLLHYLQALVYPDLSAGLLIAGAVAVCLANLAVYGHRFTRASRPRAAASAH